MKDLSLMLLSFFFFFSSCRKNEESLQVEKLEKSSAINTNSLFAGNLAIGIANNEFAKPGLYAVKTTAVRGDCKLISGLLYGFAATTGIIAPDIQCNPQFPAGTRLPAATEVWYPSNIRKLGRLPVVNLVGGIISNLGNYDTYASLWASHGFIVVNSNDFVNLTPLMHTLGAIEVSLEDKKSGSDLKDRVDLSKMIIVGHSAGAGAAINISSFLPTAFEKIDKRIKIIASMPIQPSILTSSSIISRIPSLYLAAENDEINGRFATLNYFNKHPLNIPAWFATAREASHFSPVRELERNEYAGITTAWLLYHGKNNAAAKAYFVGSGYRLQQDQQFIIQAANIFDTTPSTYRVNRNLAANILR